MCKYKIISMNVHFRRNLQCLNTEVLFSVFNSWSLYHWIYLGLSRLLKYFLTQKGEWSKSFVFNVSCVCVVKLFDCERVQMDHQAFQVSLVLKVHQASEGRGAHMVKQESLDCQYVMWTSYTSKSFQFV